MTDSSLDLISTKADLKKLADHIKSANQVAFDTEFIRENTFYPKLELIQVATQDGAWLVDAHNLDKKAMAPLVGIFKDPNILKIVHAAQGDQECLYFTYGIVARPLLDTALAASLCGYGENVGLGNLLDSVLGIRIQKGHARVNWSLRPLPEPLAKYAINDVKHLVVLGNVLVEKLDKLDRRKWALEISSKWEDPKIFEPSPESITLKIGRSRKLDLEGVSVLYELISWREKRIRELNIPRRWLAEDHVLVDLARVRPDTLEHLKTFRGLNGGEIRKHGKEMLDLVVGADKKPSKNAEELFEKLKKTKIPQKTITPPSRSEVRALELMRCYLHFLADQTKITLSHLVDHQNLLPLLRSGSYSPKQWVESGWLSEYAEALVGEELKAFLEGKKMFKMKDGNLEVTDIAKIK